MRTYALMGLIIILVSGCVHKPALVAPNPESLPVDEFSYPLKSSLDSEKEQAERSSPRVCADEDFLFLIKHPFYSILAFKDAHDLAVVVNSEMAYVVDAYTLFRQGGLSEDEFSSEYEAAKKIINQSTERFVKDIEYFQLVFTRMAETYPLCANRIKQVFSEPRFLDSGERCTLSQNLLYIEDNFLLKARINASLMAQDELRKVFENMHMVIKEEVTKKISNADFVAKMNAHKKDLRDRHLIERALSAQELMDITFKQTFDFKQNCAEDAKKRLNYEK